MAGFFSILRFQCKGTGGNDSICTGAFAGRKYVRSMGPLRRKSRSCTFRNLGYTVTVSIK